MKKVWVKRLARLGTAGLALWAASHALYRWTRPAVPQRPLVIAHRGGAALAPENTLGAFESVPDADMWETDVRPCSDGTLVLLHDSTVDRTTSGHGRLESLSSAQATQLGLPTFSQFLELARRRQARILPEIKSRRPGIEKAVVESLQAAGVVEQTCVQCFAPQSLERVHALAPELKLGRLYYPWQFWVGANPEGVVVVAPCAETLLLNPWMVRQAHARGWQVWPWFLALESRFTVPWVLSLGVDGLIVDNPPAVHELGQ